MIFRKYGATLHSVEPNFDARAMNEVGFRKNGEQELPWEEFQQKYERASGHELTAEAGGRVQSEAEEGVLRQIREQREGIIAGLSSGAVVLIESEQGKDYPKMREKVSNVVAGHENKLHFARTIAPPLRVAVYTPRKS